MAKGKLLISKPSKAHNKSGYGIVELSSKDLIKYIDKDIIIEVYSKR